MKRVILSTGAFIALATPVFAFSPMPAPRIDSIVDTVRADCRWVDNKWTYRKGDKTLVCRPDRPRGAGWFWNREGGREGWYHKSRREWHNRNW